MTEIAQRVAGLGTSIFAEMNDLAQRHNAINLGQGAPNFNPPPFALDALQRAMQQAVHQYAPGWGVPQLRQAIAHHADRFYNMPVNSAEEVLITNGTTEGIYATIMGLINPGDEVILFEPFYDSYVPAIAHAGGIPRYIPLRPPNWEFDWDELAALFSDKTRAIMINTPHNPTGKVYTRDELDFIAALCQKYDVIAITDEVYEHILFDDAQHIRMASLPGMAQRTITLSSLGKTFSVTGWKIGWVIGSPPLLKGVWQARQFISFSVASVLQWAAVDILSAPTTYFEELRNEYQTKRDFLVNALSETPLQPLNPKGSYFVMADTAALAQTDDYAAAEYLVREIGVATIPPGSFYSDAHRSMAHHLLRFSICKTQDTLQAAVDRLKTLNEKV